MATKELKDSKIVLLLFIIDMISKILVKIELKKEVTVIPYTLSLFYVKNKGVAFSFFSDLSIYLVSFITIIIIIFIFNLYIKESNRLIEIALLLIISGAVSNLFDRLLNGYVTDFIYLKFVSFPVFNFADIFVSIGVIILLFEYFKNLKRTTK